MFMEILTKDFKDCSKEELKLLLKFYDERVKRYERNAKHKGRVIDYLYQFEYENEKQIIEQIKEMLK